MARSKGTKQSRKKKRLLRFTRNDRVMAAALRVSQRLRRIAMLASVARNDNVKTFNAFVLVNCLKRFPFAL